MSVEIIPVKVPGLWPITREAGSIKVAGRLVRNLILERFPELPADRKLTCRADFLAVPGVCGARRARLRNCASSTPPTARRSWSSASPAYRERRGRFRSTPIVPDSPPVGPARTE